jgi:Dip2/Utp12 Family
MKRKDSIEALRLALMMNEQNIIQLVYDAIPINQIERLVQTLSDEECIKRLITFLSKHFEHSPSVERNSKWVSWLLTYHEPVFKKVDLETRSNLRALLKTVYNKMDTIFNVYFPHFSICFTGISSNRVNENEHMTRYLLDQASVFNY